MKLSIIIPVYNVEKYLSRCLQSCINQDVSTEDYEIIVVNDGSSDGSLAIAEEFCLAHKENSILISQVNAGLSAARNRGMDAATGDYFFFVDSDDWISDNCLGYLIDLLDNKEPDCLAFCMADFADGKYIRRISYEECFIKGVEFLRRGAVDNAQYTIWSSKFFKNNKLRFFEGIYHEDSEFTPRAYYFAQKVMLVNRIIYYVYPNPLSITRGVNYKRAFDYVNFVCTSLDNFIQHVKESDKEIFRRRISIYINNALNICKEAPLEVRININKDLFKNRYLLIHLWKSGILKYKIEFLLMVALPFCYTNIYSIINRLK